MNMAACENAFRAETNRCAQSSSVISPAKTSKRMNLLVKAIIQIVSVAFEIDPITIMRAERGLAKVARARQICCYLLHTSLSVPLIEIGEIFQKDRTTIGHACRLIEDLRDKPAFDDRMTELEKTVRLIRDLAEVAIGEEDS